MEQREQMDYEEISLREIIEVLLDGWKLIALITAICVLASGVFSFFVINPTYEARTTLMASLATDKLTDVDLSSEDIGGILDSMSSYPTMTIQTYKEQIKNPEILMETIEELNLGEQDITLNGLRNMVSLETIKDTNLITVKVQHGDKELATKIANTIADKFTSFITNMARGQASKTSKFIKSQLEVEKEKLDAALLELKVFLGQPRGVDELQQEVASKLQELNGYKDRLSKEEIRFEDELLNKEMEERKTKAELKSAKAQLRVTPEKLTTKKSLAEDQLLSEVVRENSNKGMNDISSIEMKSEEINPTYITLKNKIANYEISLDRVRQEQENIEYSYEKVKENLEKKINSVKKDMESLQVELAEKDHQNKLIQRKVNLAQSTYNSFLNKYESTRIAESTEVGESSITIVSKAVVPQHPVAPNKVLNVAIAGILGVMLGVFIVFFKSYWKTSAVK